MRYFWVVFVFCILFFAGKINGQIFHSNVVPDSIKNNVALLAKYLTKNATNDTEKASILFQWVANNIAYDDAAYGKEKRRINATTTDVLRRGQAVCLGYAQLYVEMCEFIDLQAIVIDGYSKQGNQISNAEKVDHAWSAVLIDGKWFLQDVTWASGGGGFEKYFCPSPADFVKEHLPADPMWQLLKQPVNILEFRAGIISIQGDENAFAFTDSIQAFFQLSLAEQQLKSYQNTLLFNPTAKNKEQLGQAHCDYALSFGTIIEHLQENNSIDSLFLMQKMMITHFQKAAALHPLFDWQKENYANTLINQAVVVSRKLSVAPSIKDILVEMKGYLLKAKGLLLSMKPSLFSAQTLGNCEEYLLWVAEY